MDSESSSALALFIVSVVIYLSFTVPLFVVSGKLRCSSRWMAFIPVLFLFLLAGCAKDEGGPDWLAGFILLIVIFIPLGGLIGFAWAWANIARNTGKSGAWGWLMVIPPLTVINPWIIALRAERQPDPFARAAVA